MSQEYLYLNYHAVYMPLNFLQLNGPCHMILTFSGCLTVDFEIINIVTE